MSLSRRRWRALKVVVLGLALLLPCLYTQSAWAQNVPTRGPLRVDPQHPNSFVDRDGFPVWLSGSVSCCMADGTESDWPWASTTLLDRLAAGRNNYAYIRLGPFTRHGESPAFEAYEFVGGQPGTCDYFNDCYNLHSWNQGFWDRLRQRIEFARDRGIYVEVDLIDGWILEHNSDGSAKPNPWRATNNTDHLEAGNCSIQGTSPEEVHTRWLSKVVETIGDLDNVIFQVGNETGDCNDGGSSLAWEKGIADFVNQELDQRGFPRHLFSTNSEDVSIESSGAFDYINAHGHAFVQPPDLWVHAGTTKPTGMNEYLNNESENPGEYNNENTFTRALWQGFTRGTMVHYWPGDDSGPIGNPSSQIGMAFTRLDFFRQFISETSFGRLEPQGGHVAAIPGREYVALVDQGENVTLDVGSGNNFEYEWMHTWNGSRTPRTSVWASGLLTLTAPAAGGGENYVLHLYAMDGCPSCAPPENLDVGADGFAVTVSWHNQPVGIRRLVVSRWDSVNQQWGDVSLGLPPSTTTWTDTSIHASDIGAGRTYRYKVRAEFIFGGSAESAPQSVDLYTQIPAGFPTLVSPSGMTYADIPTFRWVAPARATSYIMRVKAVAGPEEVLDVSYASGTSYTPTGTVEVANFHRRAGDQMRWSLKACNNIGCVQGYPTDLLFTLAAPPRGDFNADFRNDLLLKEADGDLQALFLGGPTGTDPIGSAPLDPAVASAKRWSVVGVNDFDLDHKSDILWRNDNTGTFVIWYMDQFQS